MDSRPERSASGASLRRARLIVMVTGAAPGLGKSTLVRNLAEALDRDPLSVTSFPEDEILARVEFEDGIASFREAGSASLDQLLDASRASIATSRQQPWDVVVQDMLFPFLPSLLAWGHSDDEISAFFHDLATCAAGSVFFKSISMVTRLSRSLEPSTARTTTGSPG